MSIPGAVGGRVVRVDIRFFAAVVMRIRRRMMRRWRRAARVRVRRVRSTPRVRVSVLRATRARVQRREREVHPEGETRGGQRAEREREKEKVRNARHDR